MTDVPKAEVCAILSVGWCLYIKEPLLLIGMNSPCSGGSRLLSCYLLVLYCMFDATFPFNDLKFSNSLSHIVCYKIKASEFKWISQTILERYC